MPSRPSKHHPAQMSSKRAVSTLRVAPGLSTASSSARLGRDPRFDVMSKGSVDESRWRQQYAHVFEMQRDEVKELKSALASSKAAAKARGVVAGSKKKKRKAGAQLLAPDEEEKLKLELSRKSNQLMAHDQAVQRQTLKSAVRKTELVAIAEGKKPFFLKKRETREAELKEQYRVLEKSGRLESYMAKKRKQRASKQRKALPNQRPAADTDF